LDISFDLPVFLEHLRFGLDNYVTVHQHSHYKVQNKRQYEAASHSIRNAINGKFKATKRAPFKKADSTDMKPAIDTALYMLLLWMTSAKFTAPTAMMLMSMRKWLVKSKLPPVRT
jgi:hypothetical protein